MDNINELIGKIRNNSDEENKKLAEDLAKELPENQSDALNRLLSDKALINKLLASREAQDILRHIKEK